MPLGYQCTLSMGPACALSCRQKKQREPTILLSRNKISAHGLLDTNWSCKSQFFVQHVPENFPNYRKYSGLLTSVFQSRNARFHAARRLWRISILRMDGLTARPGFPSKLTSYYWLLSQDSIPYLNRSAERYNWFGENIVSIITFLPTGSFQSKHPTSFPICTSLHPICRSSCSHQPLMRADLDQVTDSLLWVSILSIKYFLNNSAPSDSDVTDPGTSVSDESTVFSNKCRVREGNRKSVFVISIQRQEQGMVKLCAASVG